ncbi:MAG: hypothetical protein HYZ50_06890 [Deltaproteobacteria bacterium]|nr:hypothetical protein [Deltaproteobacteria bacterium]
MTPDEGSARYGARSVVLERRFVTCRECGWVHYVMTLEEKASNDRFLQRYQLTEKERHLYESAFLQCLRCESSANEFRAANEGDLQCAEGHLVTPVFVGAEVGTN